MDFVYNLTTKDFAALLKPNVLSFTPFGVTFSLGIGVI